jgi:pimeloyl-ACP methyl ester carboxylesterase
MTTQRTTHIVLVPGFWLGGWAWDEVADRLRAEGHRVTALTLPGLNPGDDTTVTLDTQAEAIVAALQEPADRRVLVVHSGGAVPGTLVLDRHPELVDHVVYTDTAPVRDGFVMNPELEGETFPLSAAWDEELEQGSMAGLSEDQLARFRDEALPQPGNTLREAVSLTNPARLEVPGTVVCTSFPAEQFRQGAANGVPFLAGLGDQDNLHYVDLPTGHWPMWSRPADLASVLGDVAAGSGASPVVSGAPGGASA